MCVFKRTFARVITFMCLALLISCSGRSSDDPTSTSPLKTNFILYAGIQANNGHSYILVFNYDSVANTYSVVGTGEYQVDNGASINGNGLRGVANLSDGNLLLGGDTTQMRTFNISSLTTANSVNLSSGLADVIGSCILPNGHMIVGEYGGTGLNRISVEYDAAGTNLRSVITLANTMSECFAESNTSVFLMDYGANLDNYGRIIHVTFNGSAWNNVDAFDATTISAGNSRYSFVLHTNGKLYLPPQNPEAALATRQMMVCDKSNLAGTCVVTGSDISAGTNIPTSGDADTPQGAVQIPGTNDLLILVSKSATSSAILLRYSVGQGTYTVITASSGAFPTNIPANGIRNMRIR